MKKIIAALLVFTALLSLGACRQQTAEESAPAGMKLASGEHADYLFYVPEDWRVDSADLFTAAYYSSGDSTSINVMAYGVSPGMNELSECWEYYVKEFSDVFSSMEVTAEEETKLGGVPAMRYSFDATLAQKEYRYVIVATLRNHYVYYVTYTSTPEFYENHLEALDQVIDAFAFK